MNLIALPAGILGKPIALLAYLPHFLLIQILFHRARASDRTNRRSFVAGVAMCVLTSLFMGAWFHFEHRAIETAIADPERCSVQVQPSYMTERMLGMHFKYHMALCTFDGWRPPMHDPFIVIAVWLNYPFMDPSTAKEFREHLFIPGNGPFLNMGPWDPQNRITVYKRVFPDRPIRQKCS